MLESYGTGTGIAIGASCVVLPLAAVFMAFFAGHADDKVVKRSFLVAGGVGLGAALGAAYFLGAKPGSVGRGILYGVLAAPAVIAAPAILDSVDGLVGGRLSARLP